MLIAAIRYTPGTTLGIGAALTVVLFALGVLAQFWVGSTRRLLTYELAENTALLQRAPSAARQDLKVVHRGEVLADPRVLYLALVSRGRSDIERKDFDDGKPLGFDVGARIVSVLDSGAKPAGTGMPEFGIDETS